jgi:hypothetical protein
MANRFWVGGSGTWDASDTSHWSATSGGSSGASVPTVSDDVTFDANSFSAAPCVVTVSGGRGANTVDMSAATAYALTFQGATASGHSVTLETPTFTDVSNFVLVDCTIWPGTTGKGGSSAVVVNGDWSQGTAALSAFNKALSVTHNSGTTMGTITSDYGVSLGKDCTCKSIYGGTSGIFGAGFDLTVTEDLAGSFNGGGTVTLIADGNDADLSGDFSPAGSDSGTRLVLESTGGNVINVIGGASRAGTLEIVAGTTLQFEASAEITILDAVADSDGASTLEAASGSWTFATDGVSVAVEGWTVSDSTAVDDTAGGATFVVTDGTDGGGNTGWTFNTGGIAASRRMVNT